MSKQETIKIMAMLGAFYGAGKSNPEVMATAWHLVIGKYDYDIACRAVLNYATNDRREYATFPAVGNIVQAIEEELRKDEAPIKEIIRAISYGWYYDQLSKEAQNNITEEHYNEWLKMDAEEFSNKAKLMSEALRNNRKRLQG